MDRVYAFLPSILIIACIAVVVRFYMIWIVKRFGNNAKSVEWHRKNGMKVGFMFGVPLAYVWAPAVEELVFRAPLIIAFSSVSPTAWYGIFASSGLFALAHWFGKKIWMTEILSTRGNSEHKSDDLMSEIDRLHRENGKAIMIRKVFHVFFAFPLGILAGYYGIKYQSIWVSFGIHSAWNLIMPALVPLLVLLGLFASELVLSLWDRVRWNRRWLW